ncbi:MAG TPA: acetyl-CoA carboxylase biotin carboxyl carrier protein [Chthoniobacteraceae bacterium]|jgi:acetyl-CoA carboxylase biotin carboxyl carrier protein|nr:acetyl-CoA carboxylase biotin carboxyl carrier protein [Phycisphaerae bacterium]HWB61023.1 acetyl-CoA carboxylase biotin carboxyl carrier protein [Chthoniobacteraceae bacterium]
MAKKPSPSPAGTAFTDTRRVQELVHLMAENGLTEIELVEDKSRILLRRGPVGGAAHAAAPLTHAPANHEFPPPAAPQASRSGSPVPAAPAEDTSLVPVKSPMVGTFYSSPNPDSDAYVSIGSHVDEKTVVCIIEAMKVFNEIHAEVRGTVTKVLVSNGQAIEYGQPLFMVKPG